MTTTFLAALALVATAASAAPAATQSASVVYYADLNLASAQGQATLRHRTALAIEQVCGSYAGASDDEYHAIRRCRAAATASVRPALDRLTAPTLVAGR